MDIPPQPVGRHGHRRLWTYVNRPYSGCGCAYLVIALLVLWLVLTALFAFPLPVR